MSKKAWICGAIFCLLPMASAIGASPPSSNAAEIHRKNLIIIALAHERNMAENQATMNGVDLAIAKEKIVALKKQIEILQKEMSNYKK